MLSLYPAYQSQPQASPVVHPNWMARGLKFALIPSLGWFNLCTNAYASAQTGAVSRSAIPSGFFVGETTMANFASMTFPLSGAAGLTIISIWRSRGDYLSVDGNRNLLSTRNSSNQGWSYGRDSAISGSGTGNLTRQTLTFNGVAQYIEANYTIESYVDTPVACRWSARTNTISWLRFGKTTSTDTASGSPSNGDPLMFGATGPYSGVGGTEWLDRISTILIFDKPLTNEEIWALTKSVSSVWSVFTYPHRVFVRAAAATPSGNVLRRRMQ